MSYKIPIDSEKRNVWYFLMSNMFKKELVDELSGRFVLHWNYRNYESLPQELLVFGLHVEEIYLKGNKLRNLPEWISYNNKLSSIYLEGNQLVELPQTIGSCQALEIIDVQDNELVLLPDNFGNLTNLTSLNLRGNRLQKLPKGFENLKALAFLNLTNNLLETLPRCVCDLRSLQELILDNNKLRRLPQPITQMPNLHYLSVNKNDLDHLPLQFFINRTSMTFRHNPRLNYFHYELGCDLSRNSFVTVDFDDDETWRLDLTGCATSNPTAGGLGIKVEHHNSVLKLPKELKTVHSSEPTGGHRVSRLFELSLRESYEVIAEHQNSDDDFQASIEYLRNIPTIGTLLRDGPTSRCSNCDCFRAVFTEAVLWTMKMGVSNGEEPTKAITALLLFCSIQCSHIYATQHSKEVAMRVKWFLQ